MRALLLAAALGVLAPAAFAETVDEDLVPGGKVLSTISPSGEIETYRVAAPAGSILSVDLRPGKKGAFAPALVAILSDGSAASIPAPGKTGKTRAQLPFPVDGTLQLLVVKGRGAGGDYQLKTRLRVAKGPDFQGTVAGPGGITVQYMAPAGALATVTVKATPLSELIPTILSLDGPGGPVEAFRRRANTRMDQWQKVPQPAYGPWTLTVVGNILTTGSLTGSIRWKAPRGPDEDHRGVSDPAVLHGSYGTLLAVADATGANLPSLLAGSAAFDGRGGIRTSLDTIGLAADAAAPLGIAFAATPIGAATGSYFAAGTAASVSFDLGANQALATDFTVAANGTILYAGVGAAAPQATGLLLARDEKPSVADLAGSFLYVNAATDGGGASSVEIGTLTLGAGGTVSGLGLRTAVTVVDGTPTPGAQTPVFRSGSFSVGADGTITVVTVPNIVGAPESWTSKTAYRSDILVGLDAAGGGGRLILRQGLGLSDADAAGNYLHFGVEFGAALRLRTGILAFDGAGAWAGSETVTDLAGAIPPATAPATGTYSIGADGFADFGIDGGNQGTGIVGPEARYLFSVSLGGGGVGIDLLLDLE